MRTALITGTSTGIGQATALYLARRGYHVFASMRNLEKGAALTDVANAERLPLEVIQLDVDIRSQRRSFIPLIDKDTPLVEIAYRKIIFHRISPA